MRIAVNTRLLLPGKLEGIGWFSRETLLRICKNHPEHQFIFIFDRPFSEEFIFTDNVEGHFVYPQARHPFLYYLWFEFSIPRILKKTKADVFISPDGYLSLRSKIPSLQVLHDLSFESYPEFVPYWERKYYRYFFPRYAKKAKRIATVSEYSKKDIQEKFGIEKEKIGVVYNGPKDEFSPISDKKKEEIRDQYTDGQPYFLYVGSFHPRKNILNMLKAFDKFRKSNQKACKFLMVGKNMWNYTELDELLKNLEFRDDIIFTGRLDSDKLGEVMGAAEALCYVSLFEGFGIPIVEAFSSKIPVITSNRTSMPEVAGEGALYADPENVVEIAKALQDIFHKPELRNELIRKGTLQKAKFNWEKSAKLLWENIEAILPT